MVAVRDSISNLDTQRGRAWEKLIEIASVKGGDVFAEDVEEHDLCYRSEAIAQLRFWQTNEWGTVIVGRRGGSTRFRPRELVRRAIRDRGNEAAQKMLEEQERVTEGETRATALVDHRFFLRPDLTITLRLPDDMTDREAARVSRFVEALPI